MVWQTAANRDVDQHYEAFVNVLRAACFPPRKFGIMKQTHCSIYLDRENCKIKHCMIGLQSNAPYIEPANLCPKIGRSRTRWRLFLCGSAANRSQRLQCAMMQINGSILLINSMNLALHHLSAPGPKADLTYPMSDFRAYAADHDDAQWSLKVSFEASFQQQRSEAAE